MMIYKKIARAGDDAALAETVREIADRFGEPPTQVRRLIEYARLRARAEGLGVTAITRQAGKVHVRFAEDAKVDADRLLDFVRRMSGSSLSPARVLTLPAPSEGDELLAGLIRLLPDARAAGGVTAGGFAGANNANNVLLCPCVAPSPSLALAGLAAATALPAAELVEQIVVRVNDRLITQSEFDKRLSIAARAPQPSDRPDRVEARRARGPHPREAARGARQGDVGVGDGGGDRGRPSRGSRRQYNLATDAEFDAALAQSGMTRDDLKRQMSETITLQKVIGRDVTSQLQMTDDQLRLEYERKKDQFYTIPESAHVAEIVIKFSPSDPDARQRAVRAGRGAAREGRGPARRSPSSPGQSPRARRGTRGAISAPCRRESSSRPSTPRSS